MRSPVPILCAALFLVWMALPGAAWLVGVEGSGAALQNRALAKAPTVTASGLWDGSWAKAFNDYVWDRVPFRGLMLTLDHEISQRVFGDSPLPGTILVGADDFQFVRDRTLGARAGFVDAKRLHKTLTAIERAFDDAGVPFFVVISPTKAIAHAARLPRSTQQVFEATVLPVSDGLESRAKTDAHMISLWPLLRAEHERLATATVADERLRTLFRAHDLHWNVEAGRIQGRAIVDAIAPGRWSDACAPVLDGHFVELDPELKKIYTKTGPTEPYQGMSTNPAVKLTVVPSKLRMTQSFATTSQCGLDPRHLVVVRDSFLDGPSNGRAAAAYNGGIAVVASFFATSTFMHWDVFAGEPEKARAVIHDGDVVLMQVVQSNLSNIMAHESKWIALARSMKRKDGPAPTTE